MNTRSHHRTAPGFTLLEVLITIVVVAFGLLGLAGLQVFALKNNQSASLRVAATNLTNDIIDRMKGNYLGVINDQYHRDDKAVAGEDSTGCTTNACTPALLATTDVVQWQARVAAVLPGGIGVICADATPDDQSTPDARGCASPTTAPTSYAVKIWWYDDRTQLDKGDRAKIKYMFTAFNP